MKSFGLLKALVAVALSAGIVVGATSCTTKGSVMDAGGTTRSEAEQQSLEDQFAVMASRYERMQDLLKGAQLRVADEHTSWYWISSGIAPSSGSSSSRAPRGATGDNSYFMQAIRAILPPGAVGAKRDLDPVIPYFEAQGGGVEISGDVEHGWTAYTITSDGYRMSYQVQPHGQYNLDVVSGAFWGDQRGLLHAVMDRFPEGALGRAESLPGEIDIFPDWDTPVQQ